LSQRLLVFLAGPVGSGKSTTARLVADQLRERGIKTAMIDTDEVYQMAQQKSEFGEQETWRTTRQAVAALAESFYSNGLQAVIVDSAVYSREEYLEVRSCILSEVRESFFTLFVSAEEALRRAQTDSDPRRVASRRPEVQASLYAEFRTNLPFLEEVSQILQDEAASPEEVARKVTDSILEGHSPKPT
jgi:shikimate kinase